MKSIKSSFSLWVDIGSLLMKIFYSLQVAHVSGIKKGAEAFLVFFVKPLDDLLLVVFLVDFVQTFFGLGLFTIEFDSMMNVKLDNIKMIFICQFV